MNTGISYELLDGSDILMCELTYEGNIRYISSYWAKRFALDANKLKGNCASLLVSTQDEIFFKHQLTDFLTTDRPVTHFCCMSCLGLDAEQIPLQFSLSKSVNDKKNSLLLVASEQCSVEHVIHSESAFANVNEAPPLGHWRFDISSKAVYWSDEMYEILGIHPEEYTPSLATLFEFTHPDDVKQLKAYIDVAIKTGVGWQINHRIIKPTGEHRVVFSTGYVSDKHQGLTKALSGTAQDISDKIQVEKELELLSCAAKHTTSGLVITNARREVLWVNHAFTVQTGYTLDEVRGKGLAALLQGEGTDQQVLQRIKQQLLNGENVSETILNYHKNGRTYWNKLRITAVFDQGQIARFVGVQHNITEEIEAKQSLDELTNTLKEEVARKTEKLKKSNLSLQRIATTDPLTGALNRRTLRSTEAREFKRAQRNQQPISLLLFDLDHFKNINDTYGHDAGDAVLVSIVNTVKKEIRDTDYLFRMGGEEFLLLMPNTSGEQAKQVANKLQLAIKHEQIKHYSHAISTTVSIAVLSHKGEQNMDVSLNLIDKGLYRAKSQGRDQVVVVSELSTPSS
jgi:diguanylate cyclase (GGDEF)-like protein/PAS domain S-box-containing protein